MKLYYDTESEVYYTEKEMHRLYEENAEDIYLSCGAENYGQRKFKKGLIELKIVARDDTYRIDKKLFFYRGQLKAKYI